MDRDDAPRPSHLSRRTFLRLAGLGVASATFLAACSRDAATTPIPTDSAVSLNEKIGQMVMAGFRGRTIGEAEAIARDIRERHLGGVVLFDFDVPTLSFGRNIASPDQLRELVRDLQSISPIPLLIAIDQEGGQIDRLIEENGFPPTVSAQFLGDTDDLALTREHASTIAQTLAGLGINFNLAPVVDLNVNPENPAIGALERSFSADPRTVTAHALEFVKAHRQFGVLTSLKHFPGHGSSTKDSAFEFVDVTETWSARELEPFADIIASGEVDAIMTAHVFNGILDPVFPATLSWPTVSSMLRHQLGYDGIVISDDMQMVAIMERYDIETTVQRAIEAGVDILLYTNNSIYEENVVERTVSLIRRLVRDGTIDESRIDESYARIRRLKSRIPIL